MNTKKSWLRICLCGLAVACAAVAAPAQSYHVIKQWPVGGEGGWDYLTADGANHRLYISRGTHVMVLDTNDGKIAGDIPATDGVHGIALAPDLGKGFTSNGRENTVSVFDLKTLAVSGKIKVTGTNPDAILYVPKSQRVLTFNGRTNNVTIIDAAKETVLGTVPVSGKPEFAATDNDGNVFVNIEDKSSLTEIDPVKMTATATWPLAPCEEPSGLTIDADHHRVFAVCDNEKMAVVDTTTGKVVATPTIGKGPDATGFDPARHLVFASNGEDGTMSVIHQDSPDKYTVVQTLPTQAGARTMAVDPVSRQLYTVTVKFGPKPAPTAETPRPRASQIPNSFVVLVLGQ